MVTLPPPHPGAFRVKTGWYGWMDHLAQDFACEVGDSLQAWWERQHAMGVYVHRWENRRKVLAAINLDARANPCEPPPHPGVFITPHRQYDCHGRPND